MNTSIARLARFTRHAAIALMIGGGIVGCAEPLTYSRPSQVQGEKLYAEGQYADAAGAFRNAARQNPRNYHAYYNLGNSYMQMGQHQQAIQSYKTCLDVMKVTLQGRSDAAFRTQTLNALAHAIATSDSRDLETNLAEQNAVTTANGESFLLLAKIYAYRGDADSAIEAYNRAALLAPQDFFIAKEYGLYLEHLGQNDRAETVLRKAYALNNNDPEVSDALRRIGVVPGPSLRAEQDLARPLMPKGPIPPPDWGRLTSGGYNHPSSAPAPAPAPEPVYTPAPGGTVQTPRD